MCRCDEADVWKNDKLGGRKRRPHVHGAFVFVWVPKARFKKRPSAVVCLQCQICMYSSERFEPDLIPDLILITGTAALLSLPHPLFEISGTMPFSEVLRVKQHQLTLHYHLPYHVAVQEVGISI